MTEENGECDNCDGSGEIYIDDHGEPEECRACEGTGEYNDVHINE